MVFNYYGENISQQEIANVARSLGDPYYETFTDELRRAGHFSNLSTSTDDELPYNITGYSLRKLGYAAFESQGMSLEQLESYLSQGKPLILLMWYSSYHVSTHYRVAVGYNSTHVFLHDPWNKPLWNGTYGGPDIAFNNTQFMDLWSYYGDWVLYVCPWKVDLSTPAYVRPEKPFEIRFTIAYPQPLPNAMSDYAASLCNATIALPANLSLVQGEPKEKPIGAGLLNASDSVTVSWALIANASAKGTINIVAEGKISGSVWAEPNYPAYDYNDRIGAAVNFSITLNLDNNAPTIGTPSRDPADIVQLDQPVKVSVNATDLESGVKNVSLSYTTDNGTSWQIEAMSYNETRGLYETTIPGQPPGTQVRYKIIAYDYAGNNATLEGTQPYFIYEVVLEFQPVLILPLFIITTLITIIFFKRKQDMHQKTA